MHSKVERLLFPAVTPPLEKPIGGNQAPVAGECISVSGLIRDRLRARIDGTRANTGVFCPGRIHRAGEKWRAGCLKSITK